MYIKGSLILLFMATSVCSFGQNQTDTSFSKPKVLIEAEKMASALIEGDFETYTNFVDAKSLEQAGGKKKFIQELKRSSKVHKQNKDKVYKISIANPSKVVECNGELQCVLKQETTMSVMGSEPITFATNLLAFSNDKGKKWTFINVSDNSIDAVKKMFPNVCDNLLLPKVD